MVNLPTSALMPESFGEVVNMSGPVVRPSVGGLAVPTTTRRLLVTVEPPVSAAVTVSW
jgi:hypothetical protein